MYTNYQGFPNYQLYSNINPSNYYNNNIDNDDRFLGGGLLAAGLVGGLAGAAVAPYFYRPYPMYYPPIYYPPNFMYGPYSRFY